jgi:hypothetical protein
MKNDAILNLRVPSEIKVALQRAAGANLRSMSGMATWAMAEWLTQHNFLSSTEAKAVNTRRTKGGR